MAANAEDIANNEISLNVFCIICNEFFNSNDIISSTNKCGHVYHRKCLVKWISQSNSCPQCREKINITKIHRLFLNFNEPTIADELEGKQMESFEWKNMNDGITAEEITQFGFTMGLDKEGEPVFAARVYLEEDLLPAYYVPKLKGVFAAWNCLSHFLTVNIELLHINNDDAEYKWVSAANGEVPINALECGFVEAGETLYIARCVHNERIRYGKLHPSHQCAYVPYKNKEVGNRNYEVLIRIPKNKE